MIEVPVSFGELFDKITILEIKRERITDSVKLQNVSREFDLLKAKVAGITSQEENLLALKQINEKLWEIEDEIREWESKKDFGQRFVELARLVYVTNDERAKIKRRINDELGSELVEEKSYKSY